MQVSEIVSDRWSFLIILRNELIIIIWLVNIFYDTVINRLICFFVRQSEPCALVLVLLGRRFSSVVKFSDGKDYNGAWVFDSSKLDLNFSVIIYF